MSMPEAVLTAPPGSDVDLPAGIPGRPWASVHLLPRLIATAGGVGFLRPAPGTWGSLVAALAGWAWLSWAPSGLITAGWCVGILAATFLGVWATNRCIAATGIHDPSPVVIDEVAGVWTTLLLIPPAVAIASPATASIVGFLLFRLFDIAKPWPISVLERLPRGWGVLADDLGAGLLAGFLAGACLR